MQTLDLGFNEDYGYPDTFRLEIIDYALKHSVKQASEKYNMSDSAIYKWIRHYKDITGE